jgi:hypothetical protein
MSAIMMGLGTSVYEHEVKPNLSDYMGLVFEDICRQWLFEQAKRSALPLFIGGVGRWWGTNGKTRTQEEIDLMARQKGEMLLGECKWTNAAAGMGILRDLQRKSELFDHETAYLYIFTKGRFTKELLDEGQGRKTVRLLTLEEMIEAVRQT